MTNSPNWEKHIKQKYGNKKKYSPSELQSERTRLEKKYGEKIVLGTLEDMTTDEEKMDKMEYETLTSVLQETIPEMKFIDNRLRLVYKTRKFLKSLFVFIKKIFWVISGILLMLAVIKYLLS